MNIDTSFSAGFISHDSAPEIVFYGGWWGGSKS